jgi:hypothetical protein
MSVAGWLLLAVAIPAGASVGAGWAGVARRIPDPRQPLFRFSGRAVRPVRGRGGGEREVDGGCDPAQVAGAAVPVAACVFAPAPSAALAMALVGWLLLGVAVCDERTLRIPHALWMAGIAAGLVVAWSAAGWEGMAARAAAVAALEGGLLLGAAAARRVARRDAIGGADYGVLAFVGAVCGPWVALDVLLVAGIVALGAVASQTPGRGHRPAAAALGAIATAAALFLGVGGAAAGAGALALSAARSARAGRAPRAAPFGACLAVGAVSVVLASAIPPLPAADSVRNDFVLQHLRPDLP